MKIQGTVSLHDKFQIEMKFTCPVNRDNLVDDYHIDVFFFLPRNLAVNQATYTREQFYNDLSEYIRLSTPKMDIAELAEEDNAALKRLRDAVGTEYYTEQLKMYCSILRTALRDCSKSIFQMEKEKILPAVELYVEDAERSLRLFRSLRDRIRNQEARELFDLVDEFLSITSNRHQYSIWKKLQEMFGAEAAETIARVRKNTVQEIRHLKEMQCPSVPDPEADNSELLYRESTLKKAMGSVLYLKTAMRKDGVLLENILLMVAAALAMIFVTGISFLWKGLFLEEFSLSFFIVWVIAYTFKDRIKALLQAWFSSHKDSYAFDYKQKISDAMGRKVGLCREGMCFRREEMIDPEVMRLRARTSLSRLENGSLSEEILVFRKRIELFPESCEPLYRAFRVDGVTDIVRFNVRNWLRKMDNPVKEVYYPMENGELGSIRAKRIYHVNMVIRYGGTGQKEEYIRYRLILARSGIQSVERK